MPSKVTATELKGLRESDADTLAVGPATPFETRIRLPDLEKDAISASRRGSAVHLVLQHIDLDRTGSVSDVNNEIRRMVAEEFLTEEEAGAFDPGMICRFFNTELGRRIRNAKRCRREFRFSLLNDARSIFAEVPYGDRILLQGVVDCCFEENEGLVLVDYKTDRVADDAALMRHAELYIGQLDTYAQALQRIFGLPVREKILYFLSAEKEIRLP